MKDKAINLWYKFRGYWNTPPKGYEVSYKELSNLVVGNMGNAFHGVFTAWAGMATSVPLMVSYFRVSTGILFILGLIGTVLAFIKRPILSMVIDNSRSLNGKFRRLLVVPTIISAVLLTMIPFIPQTWISTDILSFVIPAIPVMGIVEPSQVTLTLGVLVAWLLSDAAGFVYEFVAQGLNGLKNTITSVSQERSVIASVLNFFGPWPSNIFGVAIPFIAAWFFSGASRTAERKNVWWRQKNIKRKSAFYRGRKRSVPISFFGSFGSSASSTVSLPAPTFSYGFVITR